MSIEAEKLFASIKANRAKLEGCKAHRFELPEPPYKFGMSHVCANCGGEMKGTDILVYTEGYKAGGGNPSDVVPGWE